MPAFNPERDINHINHLNNEEIARQMANSILGTVRCDKHPLAKPIVACAHCLNQDAQHPVGIILMPKQYFLCGDCFDLIERHKRYDLWNELKIFCRACLADEVERLNKIHPGLFKDLTNGKPTGLIF